MHLGMTRRSPTALLTVCAAHVALVWALIVPGGEDRQARATQAWRQTMSIVPVRLLATGLPAPVAPRSAPADYHLPSPSPTAASVEAPAPASVSRRAEARHDVDSAQAQPPSVTAAPSDVARASTSAAEASAPALAALAGAAQVPAPLREAEAVRPAPTAPLIVARADRERCPPAPHPAALRERGIEGSVLLRVRVDAQGRAADIQVQAGSGWRLFDEAALQQVRGCRFVPATQDGKVIDSWVEFPVRFALAG